MLTNADRIQPSTERRLLYQSDAFRQRALERLYERKAAIDLLIVSLERYDRCEPARLGPGHKFSEMPKCS